MKTRSTVPSARPKSRSKLVSTLVSSVFGGTGVFGGAGAECMVGFDSVYFRSMIEFARHRRFLSLKFSLVKLYFFISLTIEFDQAFFCLVLLFIRLVQTQSALNVQSCGVIWEEETVLGASIMHNFNQVTMPIPRCRSVASRKFGQLRILGSSMIVPL